MLRNHESGDRVETSSPSAAAADLARRAGRRRAACTPPTRCAPTSSRCCAHARGRRVELGASPRAGLMLLRAAKARALLQGRDHALPDDVQALAALVLGHRVVAAPEALDATGDQVVADALAATPAL